MGDFLKKLEQKSQSIKSITQISKAPSVSINFSKISPITIVIDPGHGGADPGAIGLAGTREKDIVLLIAKRLQAKINAIPNMRALLTRHADYFVRLNDRVKKAEKIGADLLLSIHADAFNLPHASGVSVFALSEKAASSYAAKWLAEQENSSDKINIGDATISSLDINNTAFQKVLFDLTTTAQIKDSLRLGRYILKHLNKINHLHKPRVEQAGFAVLKAPSIPSVLIETAFLSNPFEEARLLDPDFQEEIADAVTYGIKQYFAK